MSAKSMAKGFQQTKNPYGNASKRGRGGAIVLTVIVLLIAAAIWTTRYTSNIGQSIQAPDVQNSTDPVHSATEAAPVRQ